MQVKLNRPNHLFHGKLHIMKNLKISMMQLNVKDILNRLLAENFLKRLYRFRFPARTTELELLSYNILAYGRAGIPGGDTKNSK